MRNYKNFSKSSIDLKDDITTLIGENGTGKTNLFYALRHLLDKNDKHFLGEGDFSYNLSNPRGHWIIISVEFTDVPNSEQTPEAVDFNADLNQKAVYSLIFRPNKIVRNTLHNLSQKYQEETDEAEKIIKKMQITDYIESIDIKSDYELKRTVGTIFDFENDSEYKNVVGDFENCVFVNPDEVQEDSRVIGDKCDSDLSRFINVIFIPAIRDVNSELMRDGNFFEKMLESISEDIDEARWNSIKDNFNNINSELKSIEEYVSLADNILGMMNNTVGSSFSGEMFLDVSVPVDKNKIIKYFTLKGKIDDHSIDLYNKSLGENNVIYFALKMLQNKYYKGHTKKLYNLLLIEEPESHLHKHLQQTFFTGIEKTLGAQILLSTHSVHISESCRISSMIVLGKKDERTCEVYIPSKGLDETEIRYLERYLDSIRSPILFSKNVLLVEGTAELIFIDNILKLKYDFDLNAYGISLISMDGCFFEQISKLFNVERLKKKCSILTDLDKDYDGTGIEAESLSRTRVENLINYNKDNSYVKVYTNDYTFEIENYSNNIDLFIKYVKETKVYKRDVESIVSELQSDDIKKQYKRIIMIAKKLGKGWLALDFIEWLKEKGKEEINQFLIPPYILNSLKNFFPSDIYNSTIYNQIVNNYCKKNSINPDSISDEFILYIKELL